MWLVCVEIIFIINTFHFFKDDPTVLRQHENDFLQSQGYDSDNDKENISPQKPARPMVNQRQRRRRNELTLLTILNKCIIQARENWACWRRARCTDLMKPNKSSTITCVVT